MKWMWLLLFVVTVLIGTFALRSCPSSKEADTKPKESVESVQTTPINTSPVVVVPQPAPESSAPDTLSGNGPLSGGSNPAAQVPQYPQVFPTAQPNYPSYPQQNTYPTTPPPNYNYNDPNLDNSIQGNPQGQYFDPYANPNSDPPPPFPGGDEFGDIPPPIVPED